MLYYINSIYFPDEILFYRLSDLSGAERDMENGNKLRLLYIFQHLFRYSDAEHPVTTPELLHFLREEHGMDVNRTTLPGDFAMMEKVGLHFKVVRSRQNKYYFDGRLFDIPELKILIDAISSSKFISEKKSRELIRKLTTLTSEYTAERLRRHVTVEGRVKSDNEKAYCILDVINTAIEKNCKIRFQYTEYGNRRRKVLKNEGEYYIVSPFALVWDGDYYYMIGYCDNREHMRNFRVDRIYRTPMILDEEAIPVPKGFNLAEYSRQVFRMFGSDDTAEVELLCSTGMMNGIVDQFGTNVKTEEIDEDHFKVTVTVCPSPTFYRWVFGWNGGIKILGPEYIKKEYREMLARALDEME